MVKSNAKVWTRKRSWHQVFEEWSSSEITLMYLGKSGLECQWKSEMLHQNQLHLSFMKNLTSYIIPLSFHNNCTYYTWQIMWNHLKICFLLTHCINHNSLKWVLDAIIRYLFTILSTNTGLFNVIININREQITT